MKIVVESGLRRGTAGKEGCPILPSVASDNAMTDSPESAGSPVARAANDLGRAVDTSGDEAPAVQNMTENSAVWGTLLLCSWLADLSPSGWIHRSMWPPLFSILEYHKGRGPASFRHSSSGVFRLDGQIFRTFLPLLSWLTAPAAVNLHRRISAAATTTSHAGTPVRFSGAAGGGLPPPTRMGVLHSKHETTLLRSCYSTSINLRQRGLAQ